MPSGKTKVLKRCRVYIASPLFSVAEKAFNVRVSDILMHAFDVYLPQRDGLLFANLVQEGVAPDAGGRLIFEEDVRAIQQCDIVLAVLDGRAVDEGVAFELGLAFALQKSCYGLQTDPRRLLPWGNNPMIAQALNRTFTSVSELEGWVSTQAGVSDVSEILCSEAGRFKSSG